MFRRILHAISEGKLLSFAPKSLPGSIGDGTAGMGGRANGDVGGTAGIVPSWTPSVPRTTSVWPVRELAPVRRRRNYRFGTSSTSTTERVSINASAERT